MPDLIKSLQGKDLGHLRMIADLWGLSVDAPDLRNALPRLAALLLDRPLVTEIVSDLPAEARLALDDLLNHDARMPWALFTKRYGVLREFGPARRDREHPHRTPISPAEMLWYRGLLARAFFDSPTGPEEFAYIPSDLVDLLPEPQTGLVAALGRPASPLERAFPLPPSDRILDHACTLLAALRLGLPADEIQAQDFGLLVPSGETEPTGLNLLAPNPEMLKTLLMAAGLLDPAGVPIPEPTRAWLEAPRPEALLALLRAWLISPVFNELRLLPGLKAEGEWQNDPLRARQSVRDFLSTVPGLADPGERPFWSLGSFVEAVHKRYPDFQRPAGDYDSWYLRSLASGEFLRGFENWDNVDGALIRFIITGPLYWLGVFELACAADPHQDPAAPVTAFRYSEWAAALLSSQPPGGFAVENASMQVLSDGRLVVPRLAPRSLRYLIARFTSWDGYKQDEYHYRLSPASLQRARQQGLTINHLLALLRKHAPVTPPSLTRALERWERLGIEARFQSLLVLRLSSPELLQTLRASKAGRFLGDPLGPTSVIVKPGALSKVIAILAEMGYLAEIEDK
jgi:hypothetical protein